MNSIATLVQQESIAYPFVGVSKHWLYGPGRAVDNPMQTWVDDKFENERFVEYRETLIGFR